MLIQKKKVIGILFNNQLVHNICINKKKTYSILDFVTDLSITFDIPSKTYTITGGTTKNVIIPNFCTDGTHRVSKITSIADSAF